MRNVLMIFNVWFWLFAQGFMAAALWYKVADFPSLWLAAPFIGIAIGVKLIGK